jgi:hypothetical protein
MLEKDDAQLVGFGVASNVLVTHVMMSLVGLGIIGRTDALDIIDQARKNFADKMDQMSDQRVAEFALSFFEIAKMSFGGEDERLSGRVQ